MAGNFNLEQTNSYTSGMEAKIAANSADLDNGIAVKLSGGFISKAAANEAIAGVSVTKKVFASNNQTVAKEEVIYHPADPRDFYRMKCAAGTSVVFDAALVASNTINLNVNGVAMTQVTYATSNDNTLELIATQLETQFPAVIEAAARSGTRTVAITVKAGATVTITGIVVAAGASQADGAQVDNFRQAEVGKFFDIVTTSQLVDGMTSNASANQVKLEKAESQSYNIFSITGVA